MEMAHGMGERRDVGGPRDGRCRLRALPRHRRRGAGARALPDSRTRRPLLPRGRPPVVALCRMRPQHSRLGDRVNWSPCTVSTVWLCEFDRRHRTRGLPHAAGAIPPHRSDENNVNLPTAFKDLIGVLLLVFLLPVVMAVGLGVVALVVARQLYWWARGNTTAVSRSMERARSSPRSRVSTATTTRHARDPIAAVTVSSLADAPAAGARRVVS